MDPVLLCKVGETMCAAPRPFFGRVRQAGSASCLVWCCTLTKQCDQLHGKGSTRIRAAGASAAGCASICAWLSSGGWLQKAPYQCCLASSLSIQAVPLAANRDPVGSAWLEAMAADLGAEAGEHAARDFILRCLSHMRKVGPSAAMPQGMPTCREPCVPAP